MKYVHKKFLGSIHMTRLQYKSPVCVWLKLNISQQVFIRFGFPESVRNYMALTNSEKFESSVVFGAY